VFLFWQLRGCIALLSARIQVHPGELLMPEFRQSRAREVALQLLYEHDQNKQPMSQVAVEDFAKRRHRSDSVAVAFTLKLYNGVIEHRSAIDQLIQEKAANWRIVRMLPSDRNILRMACYELHFSTGAAPKQVILNEAIELAKRFGTKDSSSFVNGVLDQIAKAEKPTDALPATPPKEQPE
jgi:N utilization substance protein B